MRGAVHFLLALGFIQAPLLPDPAKTRNTPQYITVATRVGAPSVAAGSKLTLVVDIRPNAGIHVYAPGAKAYLPIALSTRAPDGVKVGAVGYPKSETMTFASEQVPVYRKPFSLTQEITLPASAPRGSTVVVRGVVDYQACDDVICFKPATIPVTWTVSVP
jgi:DsbC/DsbD-like thiol-disulfide interchange protein